MDLIINIVIITAIFAITFFFATKIITKQKKTQINNKIKSISTESKLIAIDELRKIVKKDPSNFIAREKLADLLLQNKSYLLAIKEYLIILDHYENVPNFDEIKYLINIGKAYLSLQNYEDARKYFLIVRSKKENNFEANLNLASIESLTENYIKAEEYYRLLVNSNPDNKEVLKGFALCNFKLEKYKECADKLLTLLNYNSANNPAINLSQNTPDEKEKAKDKDKETTEDFEVLYYLSLSLYRLEKYDMAAKILIRLKKSPENAAEAFYLLGNIHRYQKMYNQAIEDYNNSLVIGNYQNKEKICEINYYLGECFFQSHKLQKAIEYWTKVAEINPDYENVSEKLENYHDVTSNNMLELYLIGSVSQFVKLCKIFIKYYIKRYSTLKGNLNYLDSKTNQDGSFELLVEVTSGNFLELNYFIFIRSATTVGDMTMRNIYNRLKEIKADKGICITAGCFSDSAKEFVESRMIKLINRDQLIEVLNSISDQVKVID